MNVQEVYEKYTIPVNLQKHMLRVAALSQIITDNWKGPHIDKQAILYTCLVHDMANIIKFDFSKPSLFKEEDSRVDYWKSIQTSFITKYGPDEHLATHAIAKELGLSSPIITLIQKLEWRSIQKSIESHDYDSAITIYCDMRVGPYGILPIQERLDNLKTRVNFIDHAFYKKEAPHLESFLQQYTRLPLHSINEDQLTSRFDSLLQIELLK